MYGWTVGGARQLKRPVDHAGNREQEHRPVAEHLLDRGRQVTLVARVELLDQTPGDGGVVGEQLERPRELRGGRLVASEDHRHQIVAQLPGARLGGIEAL